MIIFFLVWYVLTTLSSGTCAPSGIFLPMIIIGCALGFIYYDIFHSIFPDYQTNHASTYSIIASAAMLAGSTRMTYSLAVIMMETTQNVNLFLPIIFAMFCSYGIGNVFNKSIYYGALRSKNIPVLLKGPPKQNLHLQALQIMNTPIKTFHFIVRVSQVAAMLTQTPYNGFPVVNAKGKLKGLINRHTLITMIKHSCWYNQEEAFRHKSESKNKHTSLNVDDKDSMIETLLEYDSDDDEGYPISQAKIEWYHLNSTFNFKPLQFESVK